VVQAELILAVVVVGLTTVVQAGQELLSFVIDFL
jgi:hypothetical protein